MKQNIDTPLMIYIGENEHGDMSYASLAEQIIKRCEASGLKVQTFSEFASQAEKFTQTPRIPELMTLENSEESVKKTAEFLDGKSIEDRKLIKMGDLKERFRRGCAMWESLPKDLSPSQVVDRFRDNVDNVEVLKFLNKDAKTGFVSEAKDVGNDTDNLWKFFKIGRNALTHKQTHEKMAEDVRSKLEAGTDVAVIIVGAAHIPGLNSQLPELRGSKKIVVGNYPEGLDAKSRVMWSGGIQNVLQSVGNVVGFQVDYEKKVAVIPQEVQQMIGDLVVEKSCDSSLTPQEGNKSWIDRIRNDKTKGTSLGKFKEL